MSNDAVAPAVDLREVCKRMGPVRALDRVSLTLPRGQRHALTGPNGSGKTTLLRMLAGLIVPDSGEARSLGFNLRAESSRLRHDVAYVTQHFSLYGELTVRENLAFVAAVRAVSAPPFAIASAFDDFDLRIHARKRAQTLSDGVRQRLQLAAALMGEPAMLLLDEPTAALDSPARDALWRKLDELRNAKVTLILTTHRAEDVDHCDTRTELLDGRVVGHTEHGTSATDTPVVHDARGGAKS